MNKIKNASAVAAGLALVASVAFAVPAFAQTNGSGSIGVHGGIGISIGVRRNPGGPMMPAGIFGQVTAVNGNTLTVATHAIMRMKPQENGSSTVATSTVYTVDASNAQIYKGSATSTVSVSNIAVNDTVMVQGATSGTNVTATKIYDGIGFGRPRPGPVKPWGNGSTTRPLNVSTTFAFKGNGEPVVGGNVTAVSGSTLTVTNPGGQTYTIDVSAATITKGGATTTASGIAVNDSIIVQGTVNGNAVAASAVIDQGAAHPANSSSTPSSTKPHGGFGIGAGVGGFFGAIGGFFQHLFGF